MKGKRKTAIKYGELAKKIFSHIIDSLTAGYEAGMRHNRSYEVFELIEAVGKMLMDIDEPRQKRRKVFKVLRRLEKQKIIDLKRDGDKVFVYLKNKYHPKIIKYSIKSILNLKLKKKKWEKKWIIVFFDIPEEERNKREYLRNFLKEIGFYPYQKSVYIFPYECKKEIDLIRKIIVGNKYLKYVIATQIEDEDKIKRYFNIA